jgi:hypothetical protein
MAGLTIRSQKLPGQITLARALKHRAPALTCRVCDNRDFAMVEFPDEGYRSQLRRQNKADGRLSIDQPLISLICTTCGHIEQFAEAILNGAHANDYGEDLTGE